MTEINRSVKINALLDKVFQYTSNYENWSEFFDAKPITETQHGNGAKFIYKVKAMGMKVTVGTELNEFKENEGWRGKSFKGMEDSTQWIFKKSNGGTELTYILKYSFPWYFGGKLIDKMFATSEGIKIIENSLQNIKRIMETK